MDSVKLKKIFDSIGLMQKNLECSICLEMLQDPVSTKCDHQFCNFCAMALLQNSRKPSAPCPLCKIPITKRSLTKNKQLNDIVCAVRSVISAVEEDTGQKCSPPRGPVLISQPDPRPKLRSPQKKVRGQQQVKGRKRTRNVRQTRKKAAGSVSVYLDASDDSDGEEMEPHIVGHTNVSSSFPHLAKKGKHAGEEADRELEREAEDLLDVLNAAPQTRETSVIPGYSDRQDNVEQLNQKNLQPTHDSEIFDVPAPPQAQDNENLPMEGETDPYEFVPSQRTPQKGVKKRKVQRKKNKTTSKALPNRSKGKTMSGRSVGSKLVGKSKDMKENMKNQEECIASHSSKIDRNCNNPAGQSDNQKTLHASDHVKNIEQNQNPEKIPILENGEKRTEPTVLTQGTDDVDDVQLLNTQLSNKSTEEVHNVQAAVSETSLAGNKVSLPPIITPTLTKRSTRASGPPLATQSSDGVPMADSQPVTINKNHGHRVFATVYGKAKKDKSPPLDPQERVLDWLVSKSPDSDNSDEESDREEMHQKNNEEVDEKGDEDDSEELPDVFQVTPSPQKTTCAGPSVTNEEDGMDIPSSNKSHEKLRSVCDGEVVPPVPNRRERKTRSSAQNLDLPCTTPPKSEVASKLEPMGEKTTEMKTKLCRSQKRSDDTRENKENKQQSSRHSQEKVSGIESVEMDEMSDKEHSVLQNSSDVVQEIPKRKSVKQRMVDNLREEKQAHKESEAAAIKSDWELALELARQFGTEPEHLKCHGGQEKSGRALRRRKGKLAMESVNESNTKKRAKHAAQESRNKENKSISPSNESIKIDSFDTEKVKGANRERIRRGKGSLTNDQEMTGSSVKVPLKGDRARRQDKCSNSRKKVTEQSTYTALAETPEITELQPGHSEVTRSANSTDERGKGSVVSGEGFPNHTLNQCTPDNVHSQSSLRRSMRLTPVASIVNIQDDLQSDEINITDAQHTTNDTPHDNADENVKTNKLPERQGDRNSTAKAKKAGSREKVTESMPLFTEDACHELKSFKDDLCNGSDTTETIEMDVSSDAFEEPGGDEETHETPLMELRTCSVNVDKQKYAQSLDDEMAIMDNIMPSGEHSSSIPSCPGLSAEDVAVPVEDSCETDVGQLSEMEKNHVVRHVDDLIMDASLSSRGDHQSQTSGPIIVSQVKISDTLPSPSYDSCTQPSESLLKPVTKPKGRSPCGKGQTAKGDQNLSSPKEGDHCRSINESFGVKVDILNNDQGEKSPAATDERPSSRMTRKKRKTFMLGVKKPANPRENAKSNKSIEDHQHGLTDESLQEPGEETKSDNPNTSQPSCPNLAIGKQDIPTERTLRSRYRTSLDKNSSELSGGKQVSPIKGDANSQRTRSLPVTTKESSRRRKDKNDDKSQGRILSNASQEQDTAASPASAMELRRKSRGGCRKNHQNTSPTRAIKDSTIAEINSNSLPVPSLNVPNEREKIPPEESLIPTTPGASEITTSSNLIITRSARVSHKRKNAKTSREAEGNSGINSSSPRMLRRSRRTKPEDVSRKVNNIQDSVSGAVCQTPTNPDCELSNVSVDKDSVVDSPVLPANSKEESMKAATRKTPTSPKCEKNAENEDIAVLSADRNDSQGSHQSLLSECDINSHEDSGDIFCYFEEEGKEMKESLVELGAPESSISSSSGKDALHSESNETVSRNNNMQFKQMSGTVLEVDVVPASLKNSRGDDTEALIPPTPPCLNASKASSAMSTSIAHSKRTSKGGKTQKRSRDTTPLTTASLVSRRDSTHGEETSHGESLVMETPAASTRKRGRTSNATADTMVSETPDNLVHGRRISPLLAEPPPLPSMSAPEATEANLRKPSQDLPFVGDTPVEVITLKSSNESEELIKASRKRSKVLLSDESSDDSEEDELIGRSKPRRAQRMNGVAEDEENESDEELISCSFLHKDEEKDQGSLQEAQMDAENIAHYIGGDGDSVSSQGSCASQHLNLTSASSIFSSQSEIMSTQQREVTREKLQTLEAQMLELQAVLANSGEIKSREVSLEDEADLTNGEEKAVDSDVRELQGGRRKAKDTPKGRGKMECNGDDAPEVTTLDDEEPRSPSPPPPLSPRSIRNATMSSLSDSINTVSRMVEQFRRSSSSKKVNRGKQMAWSHSASFIADDSDSDSGDDVVCSKKLRLDETPSTRTGRREMEKRGSTKRKKESIKRRSSISSGDSDEDQPDSGLGSHSKRMKLGHHTDEAHSRTTPRSSTSSRVAAIGAEYPSGQTLGLRNSSPKTPCTPQQLSFKTPRICTPHGDTSSVPSPADVSMRSQPASSKAAATPTQRSLSRSKDTSPSALGRRSSESSSSAIKSMSLIATGLNRVELRHVEQLASRIANCRFASAFNANTTHVIVKTDSNLVCERTLKYFQGIAARAWIVSFQWIEDSLRAGRVLAEEGYEVRGDVVNGVDHRGPKRARTWEGTGFLADYDLCCIGPFTGLNKDQLVGLCEMCGASTVQHPSLFPYTHGRRAFILVEPSMEETERDYRGLQKKFRVPVISREWILDSVAQYRAQPITDYLLSDFNAGSDDEPIIDLDSDDDEED